MAGVVHLPAWLTGLNVETLTVTPLSVSGTGVISELTALSFSGLFENVSFKPNHQTVSKQAADQYHSSQFITGRGVDIEIRELETFAPIGAQTSINHCLYAVATAGYVKVSCSRVAPVGQLETWTCYCTILDGGEDIDHDNATGTLNLRSTLVYSVDTGVVTDITETYENAS